MKIVFMGTPDFSVPILEGILEENWEVVGVVTQPDRPKGRKKILTPPPVKQAAEVHGIPVLQPKTLKKEENVQAVLDLHPDVIITAAFGQLLPESLLSAPPYKAVNVHASLLPKYRGGAPIHQAVIDGEEKSGVTIMYMEKEMDAGGILARREVAITEVDTAGTLHDKLSAAGRNLLLETLPRLADQQITSEPQDSQEATFAPNIKRGREKINWNEPGHVIYNQVRGMNPWPGAYTTYKGKPIKIWETRKTHVSSAKETAPGTILALEEDGIVTAAADDTAVIITSLQPSGKKAMKAADYLRGSHELKPGERFNGDENNV
ncbi:methionyl-tRNA formyltransferase [Salibacterium halotolerans]|uniref:Methionyl-tRNA formyltransferase n=1 Tax=Salibacterium halotolerans TaxID=1884432 RepID=A0A1I5M8R9_9BACI|nr:methionyl-tRNA formyltransferase [Salibacterium halotolerans]SFP05939.1 methionyl-tRNA formyltransferase [Salibacterium halotolerans]